MPSEALSPAIAAPSPSAPAAEPLPERLSAFAGFERIASGPAQAVLAQLRSSSLPPDVLVRVFDDATGTRLDLDLRPQAAATAAAPAAPAQRSVGRPRLGVVAREVTLLPRHWDWLNRQPGGASVALRRLVDEARHVHRERDALRAAREATYRCMTEMAGNLPGFEEATRALFAGDGTQFNLLIDPWPQDLRDYLLQLSATAWNNVSSSS
ncbi:DUF2239 family protein [Variovorax soli]|uniref:DUF2239 family protein n=1 Tax=Variovorax soli TaxID=376815 RepID=UPI000837DC4F|nr:DUF2239 family protein [Variovorax soli]